MPVDVIRGAVSGYINIKEDIRENVSVGKSVGILIGYVTVEEKPNDSNGRLGSNGRFDASSLVSQSRR